MNFEKRVHPEEFCYIDIKLHDGNLSMQGWCPHSFGQISSSIRWYLEKEKADKRKIRWNKKWDEEKLLKLLDIWDKWHLNDKHPECEHQRELGWNKEAKKVISKYIFTLSSNKIKEKNKLKDEIIFGFLSQKEVENTKERRELLSMPYKKVVYTDNSEESVGIIDNMKAKGYDYEGVESVTRGWIPYEECHEYGILGKPCPVCGYKYGTSWKKVELPSDVVSFLEGL